MAYTWTGMKKISFTEAKKRFAKGLEVFRLYEDDTEGGVNNEHEIISHHSNGGKFGYEK